MAKLEEVISFHHLGLAVREFEKPISFYSGLGYEISDIVSDENQSVELIMCKHLTQPNIELIKPFENNSSIKKLLEKNNEIIYHTCYTTNSIDTALHTLRKTFKVLPLVERKEAILFENKIVSFYYVQGVGIFEFLEII